MNLSLSQLSDNKKVLGGLCSFTVSFTFCLHFFVAKDVLQFVPPTVLGGVRGVFGGLLLYAIYFRQIGSINFKALKMLLGIAFFGYFINQILFLSGLKLSTPLNTSVIMNMIPVVAALIAMLFKVEFFSWKKLGGCFLGFATIVCLTLYTSKNQIGTAKIGDLLIFISVVTLCISTMLTKKLVKTGFPSAMISASMLFIGGLALLSLGPLIQLLPDVAKENFIGEFLVNLRAEKVNLIVDYSFESTMNFAKIIFEIVISTALTYLLSFKALQYLSPSQSMIFIYLQPLMVAGIDYLAYSKLPPLVLIPVLIGVVTSAYIVMSQDSR